MTLKEQYWKDGNIFRMSTNEYRMVWGNSLINKHGRIAKLCINNNLHYVNSTNGEHVIEVYKPNLNAQCLENLIEPNDKPIWSRYNAIYTMDEIKENLGFTQDTEIFILSNNTR